MLCKGLNNVVSWVVILSLIFTYVKSEETCGDGNRGIGICADGRCCSQWGWCGSGSSYCGDNQSDEDEDSDPFGTLLGILLFIAILLAYIVYISWWCRCILSCCHCLLGRPTPRTTTTVTVMTSTMATPIYTVDADIPIAVATPITTGLTREISRRHVSQAPEPGLGRQTSIDRGPNYIQISSEATSGSIV